MGMSNVHYCFKPAMQP